MNAIRFERKYNDIAIEDQFSELQRDIMAKKFNL